MMIFIYFYTNRSLIKIYKMDNGMIYLDQSSELVGTNDIDNEVNSI